MKKALLLLTAAITLEGCVTAVPTWTPPISKQSLTLIDAEVKPKCSAISCYGFALELQNKTNKPVEIDWNRSYYIQNGQTNGGLMTEGVIISQRNMVRPPDVILPNGRYSKIAWPSNFTNLQIGLTSAEWISQMLPEGSQGVFITIKQADREEYIKSEMTLSMEFPNGRPGITAGGINIINGDK